MSLDLLLSLHWPRVWVCEQELHSHDMGLEQRTACRGAKSKTQCARCSVGREKRTMAEICVKAVLAVADLERRDVNLDLIKVSLLLMQ